MHKEMHVLFVCTPEGLQNLLRISRILNKFTIELREFSKNCAR